MNKLTAAYLAGIIDGEGSIGFRKIRTENCIGETSIQPRLRVSMCDKEFMEWLKNSFGGGLHTRPGYKTLRGIKRSESYCWSVYGSKMREIIKKVYPYLRIKKKHAEVVMKYWKTFQYIPVNHTHKELSPEMRDLREDLYRQLRLLQIKGINAAAEETERENPSGVRQSDTSGKKQEITI